MILILLKKKPGEESHLELIAVTTTFEGQKKSSVGIIFILHRTEDKIEPLFNCCNLKREEEIKALLSEEITNLEEFKTTVGFI